MIDVHYWTTPKINPNQGGIRTEEERRILFGQTAAWVATAAQQAGG